MFVEALEDGDGDGPLVLSPLSRRATVVAVVPLHHHPNANQEMLELTVVGATIPIKLLLKNIFCFIFKLYFPNFFA